MSNDSNTTLRDELLRLHAPLTRGAQEQPEYRDNTESALYGYSEGVEHALDTVWAKGYRKPRTITTVEELDALPVGSVIRADNGEVFEKQADGPYCDGPHDWQSFEGTYWNGETFTLPATVLHEPEAEATR